MDPALITLLKLHARAFRRRTLRGARTARGAIYFMVGLLVIGAWLVPQIIRGIRTPPPDPRLLREMFPLALLGICILTLLTNGGGRAFYFTPAEVDYLFPGPFPRRDVLLYKVARSFNGALLGSLIFSCFMMRRVHHWFASYVAIVLAMMFLQLFSMMLVLLGQVVAERAFTRWRKIVLALAALAIGVVIYRATPHGVPPTREAILGWIRESRVAQIVLSPFSVFGRVATAERLTTDLPIWSAGAIALDGVLLMLVLLLDADYLETAAASSEKMYARRMRARRGQGMSSATISTALRLPELPRFGGVGPLAWRQLTGAIRTARTTLIIFAIATLGAGPFISRVLQTEALGPILGVGGWLTLFTTNLLRFDFRGDLEQIDTLKALPVPSWSVVLGEVATPVAVLSTLHLLLLLGLALVEPASRNAAACAAVIVIPLNLLFSMIENLIFLLFPVREANVSPGDLQGTGRRMIVLILKLFTVLIVGGIAGLLGALVFGLTNRSMMAGCITAAAVLLCGSASLVPVLAAAFTKFDPSLDTPA